MVIPESNDIIFQILIQIYVSRISVLGCYFKIFYALYTEFIDQYTVIHRYIDQFAVLICILNYYVLRCIDVSQYCPISIRYPWQPDHIQSYFTNCNMLYSTTFYALAY